MPREIACDNDNNVPMLQTLDDPIESTTSVTMQKVQLPAISRNLKLFCSVLDDDNKIVTALELNPALLQLFANENTSTKFASQACKAIEIFKKTWSNSNNYLQKETDLPCLSHLIIMMFMTVN